MISLSTIIKRDSGQWTTITKHALIIVQFSKWSDTAWKKKDALVSFVANSLPNLSG